MAEIKLSMMWDMDLGLTIRKTYINNIKFLAFRYGIKLEFSESSGWLSRIVSFRATGEQKKLTKLKEIIEIYHSRIFES